MDGMHRTWKVLLGLHPGEGDPLDDLGAEGQKNQEDRKDRHNAGPMIPPYSVMNWRWKYMRPSSIVNMSSVFATTRGQMKRLQVYTQLTMEIAASADVLSGKMIRQYTPNSEAPSMRAASPRDKGLSPQHELEPRQRRRQPRLRCVQRTRPHVP